MIRRKPAPTIADLRRQHTPEAIRHRLQVGPGHSYLSDFIYGAIDGTVTTFAVVAGVTGAELSAGIVVILGMANLLGDGFSMAVSNFLGTRAEHQLRHRARRTEEMHIASVPEGEREEIRQIFAGKGFSGTQLEEVVEVITADHERWINMMMTEELGLTIEGASPWRAAMSTLVAFIAIGLLPLLAYVYVVILPGSAIDPFIVSSVLTGAAFFIVGTVKGQFVDESWWRSGIETTLVGGVAAILAFAVGVALKGLV